MTAKIYLILWSVAIGMESFDKIPYVKKLVLCIAFYTVSKFRMVS